MNLLGIFRYTSDTNRANTDRRKSAGDEEMLKQLNVYVRTRTDSGKPLSDIEILSQVPVKNLDTGSILFKLLCIYLCFWFLFFFRFLLTD